MTFRACCASIHFSFGIRSPKSCLTAVTCNILKYYDLQHCVALRCERRTRQFRWFVAGESNCDNLLRNAKEILKELEVKNNVVLYREVDTAW